MCIIPTGASLEQKQTEAWPKNALVGFFLDFKLLEDFLKKTLIDHFIDADNNWLTLDKD